MPEYKIGQRLANAQGQVIEFNGTGWVPAQQQTAPLGPKDTSQSPAPGIASPDLMAQHATLGIIEGGPEARNQQNTARVRAEIPIVAKKMADDLSGYGMGMAGGNLLGAAGKMIPRLGRAGAKIAEVEARAGKQIVDITGAEAAASRMQELPGPRPPKVIGDFIKRLENAKKGPLTLSEARDFYKQATKLSVEETKALAGEMGMRVKEFAATLNDGITRAAEKGAGMGQKYLEGLKEYHGASRLSRGAEKVKELVTRQGLQGAATGAGIAGGGAGVYAILKAMGVIK